MRIYNEIAFDVDGNVIYEDSYEYSGNEVMLFQRGKPNGKNGNGHGGGGDPGKTGYQSAPAGSTGGTGGGTGGDDDGEKV